MSFNRLMAFSAMLSSLALGSTALGQTRKLGLEDLSAFQNPGKSWQVVGDVQAELGKENKLQTEPGKGVLVNLPKRKGAGKDLYTAFEHGDADIELDYMMAPGANSGVYLQGLYEVQLEDSWGKTDLSAASNGGVYERWDSSRPRGQEGYQGHAPRQNAGRAPGLWQHLKISFQAPRFDAQGNKVENAKILRAELNGVTIHENVELFGPTRGADSEKEVAKGPLRLQGDHGAVAFRNVTVTEYKTPQPELENLHYAIYPGRFDAEPNYANLKPESEGASATLNANLGTEARQYLLRYTGTMLVKEPGEYTFHLTTPGGGGLVKVNGKEVMPMNYWNSTGSVKLPAGKVPVEVIYAKQMDWAKPAMTLQVSGPALREFLISDKEAQLADVTDPILVDPKERPVLRSFIDLPGDHRVTHAVSVGSPEQLHYTYDMDNGALVQLWRGAFLDATPMWHERGDGSSRATGSVQLFGKPAPVLARLSSEQQAWVTDTTGTSYRQKGYRLNQRNEPTFKYQLYGSNVQDAISLLENGKGIQRQISVDQPAANLYARLADGNEIEEVSKGTYLVDGKAYYIRLDEAGGAKPLVRNIGGRQELIVPVRNRLVYSILY